MSLINDALKQAGRTPKTAAAAAASPAAGGLRPVDEARSGRGKPVVLPIVFCVVLAGAGWFIWQWWQTRGSGGFNLHGIVQSAKALLPGAKPAAADPKAAATAPPAAGAAAPGAGASKPPGNFLTRVFNKQPAGGAEAAAKPGGFPAIKVQGIYYRVGDSSVLINGRNLSEGDEIDGVTVAKIDRQTVTLSFQGQSREIKLH